MNRLRTPKANRRMRVRTGKPNRAASTWASSMIREPLCGEDMVVPVTPESKMAMLSPRRVVFAHLSKCSIQFGPYDNS